VRFSDRFLMDARTVTGTYPQAHMKGATGTVLCLYNRRTKRAETQEMVMAAQPVASAEMKDIRWRATDMGGASVGQSTITLMFGSDGKITGKSACNNYSANYSLNGNDLRVYAGMIGTRMACPKAVMAQETQFRKMLAAATSAMIQTDGMMTIAGPGGQAMTFMRASEAAN
jgi:heat shock protein HslJ